RPRRDRGADSRSLGRRPLALGIVTMAMSQMRSPLGRVLGLGSAKEGVEHWWMQRLTAIAMVPLAIWFVVAALGLIGADRAAMATWMHNPMSPVFAILLIVAAIYHLALGLQVVIE